MQFYVKFHFLMEYFALHLPPEYFGRQHNTLIVFHLFFQL